MRKRLTLAGLTAALGIGLVGLPGSAAGSHCSDIFVFTGTQQAGLNAGAFGCILDDENYNTNITTPGATHASVGSLVQPDSGTLTVGETTTQLSFTYNEARERWESERVALTGPGDLTATVTTPSGHELTVTYKRSL
jgi:hypothetical protein